MMRAFIAGATGAIGRRLVPILVDGGYAVAGTTRNEDKAALLRGAGVTAFVVDVYDASALNQALANFKPDIVIHQLTDLPANLEPSQMRAGIERNARIRREGTRNLVDAAKAAGAKRLVAQSIAWAYAPGPEPHSENDRLDTNAAAELRSISVGGIAALESAVLGAPGVTSIVLRYGQIYGPGTGADEPPNEKLSVHVDAAAHAALLAITKGKQGIYNIAERDAAVTSVKARQDLRWDGNFRLLS